MTSVDRSGRRRPDRGPSRRQPDDELRASQDSTDSEYNLAARVHGNGDTDSNGSNGRYNLAARIYGNDQTNGRAESENAGVVEADRFNLAARVFGNGVAHHDRNGDGAAVGLLEREDAPRPAPGARRRRY
jgi:hypothetical protein